MPRVFLKTRHVIQTLEDKYDSIKADTIRMRYSVQCNHWRKSFISKFNPLTFITNNIWKQNIYTKKKYFKKSSEIGSIRLVSPLKTVSIHGVLLTSGFLSKLLFSAFIANLSPGEKVFYHTYVCNKKTFFFMTNEKFCCNSGHFYWAVAIILSPGRSINSWESRQMFCS